VTLTETPLQVVHVTMDTMNLPTKSVSFVQFTVPTVLPLPSVPFVLETESISQIVSVQLVPLITVKLLAQIVVIDVLLVLKMLEIVPNVLVSDLQFLNVHVLMDIMKTLLKLVVYVDTNVPLVP
jgi:hypothetical protein